MAVMETWIYALVDKSFVRFGGAEYAHELNGPDVQLFADYSVACAEKYKHQQELYKIGYRLVVSGYQSIDPDLCFWSRVEKNNEYAHVLAIYKKVVLGDLFQVRRG